MSLLSLFSHFISAYNALLPSFHKRTTNPRRTLVEVEDEVKVENEVEDEIEDETEDEVKVETDSEPEHALCIMHYELCITHYELCITHYALSARCSIVCQRLSSGTGATISICS